MSCTDIAGKFCARQREKLLNIYLKNSVFFPIRQVSNYKRRGMHPKSYVQCTSLKNLISTLSVQFLPHLHSENTYVKEQAFQKLIVGNKITVNILVLQTNTSK